jgi:Protein of unknown function (DUF4231)
MKFIPPYPEKLSVMDGGVVAMAEEYGLWVRKFYDARANWHRRLYRLSGILVILTGASLPVLTSFEYPGKAMVISVAGLVVAGFTGLRAFYRWDQSWILLRNTEIAVTTAYLEWRANPDNFPATKDDPVTDAHEKAAHMFIGKLGEMRQQEAAMYFKDLSFPNTDGKKT